MAQAKRLNGGPSRPADLRKLYMFKHVEDNLLEEIYPLLQRSHWRRRTEIRLRKEFHDQVGFVWSGRFRFAATRPQGEVVSLYSIASGESFGFATALARYRYGEVHRLLVDEDGIILALAADRFRALQERSQAFSLALTRALNILALDYGARVYELAVSDVRTRLVAALLRRADLQNPSRDRVLLSPTPTHIDLAAEIGASREGVTRALHALARKEVLKLQRGRMTILSLSALRTLDKKNLGRRYEAPPS